MTTRQMRLKPAFDLGSMHSYFLLNGEILRLDRAPTAALRAFLDSAIQAALSKADGTAIGIDLIEHWVLLEQREKWDKTDRWWLLNLLYEHEQELPLYATWPEVCDARGDFLASGLTEGRRDSVVGRMSKELTDHAPLH